MSKVQASHSVGLGGREGHDAIGKTDAGAEVSLPLLVAGDGVDQKNPEPGTIGWEQIVQAGMESAAMADPPNEQESNIWRRVAEEKLPLDFVKRDKGLLLLQIPPSWHLGAAPKNDESPEASATVELALKDEDGTPPEPAPGVQHLTLQANLTRFLCHALDEAPLSVTVSSSVTEAVHHGNTHIYPWDTWAYIVEAALQAVADRLLPDEDGVVVGKVADGDAVTQALALLAKATGGARTP